MKDNNFIKKLILAAAAFIAQILIVMIIIFIFPDFLVGLSALSSTSNTVKTVSRPLDIVLVVDTSGSMENSPHMGTRPESERYRYEEMIRLLKRLRRFQQEMMKLEKSSAM